MTTTRKTKKKIETSDYERHRATTFGRLPFYSTFGIGKEKERQTMHSYFHRMYR
jgi:hypothetical protein